MNLENPDPSPANLPSIPPQKNPKEILEKKRTQILLHNIPLVKSNNSLLFLRLQTIPLNYTHTVFFFLGGGRNGARKTLSPIIMFFSV